jgi:hypothetical protein
MDNSETEAPAAERRSHRLIRLDPTLNAGHILQMVLLGIMGVGGYGAYQADKTADRLEVAQIKRDADQQRSTVKESLTDLKGDVKDIQRTLIDVNQSLAVLKSRQEPKPAK